MSGIPETGTPDPGVGSIDEGYSPSFASQRVSHSGTHHAGPDDGDRPLPVHSYTVYDCWRRLNVTSTAVLRPPRLPLSGERREAVTAMVQRARSQRPE